MMTDREALDLMFELFMNATLTDQYGDLEDTTPYEEALSYLEARLSKNKKLPRQLLSKSYILGLIETYKTLKDNPVEYVLNTLQKTIEEEEPEEPSIEYFKGEIDTFHTKDDVPETNGLYVTKDENGFLGFTQFKDGNWNTPISEWAEFQLMGKWV